MTPQVGPDPHPTLKTTGLEEDHKICSAYGSFLSYSEASSQGNNDQTYVKVKLHWNWFWKELFEKEASEKERHCELQPIWGPFSN